MSELVDKKIPIQIFVLQSCKFQNNLEMAEEEKKNHVSMTIWYIIIMAIFMWNQLEGNMLTDHTNVIHT